MELHHAYSGKIWTGKQGQIISAVLPVVKIKRNSLVVYPSMEFGKRSMERQVQEELPQINYELSDEDKFIKEQFEAADYKKQSYKDNLIQYKNGCNRYNGYLSDNTKRKINNMVDPWIESVLINKERMGRNYDYLKHPTITFVTLTLSDVQKHSDAFIKREMLGRFITECKEKNMFNNYLWRAEAQKNGNIHFHILIDKYVEWYTIRKIWNKYQRRNGYMRRYYLTQKWKNRKGFKFNSSLTYFDKKMNRNVSISRERQYKSYLFGVETGWQQPNSTDIKAVQTHKDIQSYMLKYLTKTETEKQITESNIECIEYRFIDGRIWGCNKELKNFKPYYDYMASNDVEVLFHVMQNAKKLNLVWEQEDMNIKVYTGDVWQFMRKIPVLWQRYGDYLMDLLHLKTKNRDVLPTVPIIYENFENNTSRPLEISMLWT